MWNSFKGWYIKNRKLDIRLPGILAPYNSLHLLHSGRLTLKQVIDYFSWASLPQDVSRFLCQALVRWIRYTQLNLKHRAVFVSLFRKTQGINVYTIDQCENRKKHIKQIEQGWHKPYLSFRWAAGISKSISFLIISFWGYGQNLFVYYTNTIRFVVSLADLSVNIRPSTGYQIEIHFSVY